MLWLAATGVLYVFGNDFGTRVIVYASILLPIFSIMLAGLLPRFAGFVHHRVRRENLFSGEIGKINFSTHYCGVYETTTLEKRVYDIFGLWGWKKTPPAPSREVILPTPDDNFMDMNPEAQITPDSDEYSQNQPGNDPGETFAIREYIPGDPLKSIHWKLSNKTDKLLVRELGLPVESHVLLLMETTVPSALTSVTPSDLHKMATRVYNIARGFVLQGLPLTLGWLDTTSLLYESREVKTGDALDAVFGEILANRVKPCPISTVGAYSAAAGNYSNMIVAGMFATDVMGESA